MGNMREISIEECMRVSGGEIVVSGRRPVPGSTNFAGTYGPVYNSSMLPAGIMGSYEDIYDPDGDDDGDGVRNMDEEIVVTAGVTHGQIPGINAYAAWLTWGQNVALNALIAERLLVSGLTNIGQTVTGVGIGSATSLPPLADAQYQANWSWLYGIQRAANEGYTPENGTIYLP